MKNLEDFDGKIKYIHAVVLDKYGKWSVVFYPGTKPRGDKPSSLERIRELQGKGLKNVLKKDDDGYYISFARQPEKVTSKGKRMVWGPPHVVGPDGKPMDGTKIGWGSDATIRLDVYEHPTSSGGKAYAARWEAIRIDNLIEWVPEQLPPTERQEHNSMAQAEEPPLW